MLELQVMPLLLAEGRLAEGGALYGDPLAVLARAEESRTDLEEHTRERFPAEHGTIIRELGAKQFRETAVQLVRALRAAGRSSDVHAVVDEARRLDPSEEMSAALALTDSG